MDKVTAVTYDAGGNQLTVRDPKNVGADMVYDNLGRNTQRTDNLLSTISFSNTNIGNLGYSWNANKNKTAETIAGVMSAATSQDILKICVRDLEHMSQFDTHCGSHRAIDSDRFRFGAFYRPFFGLGCS